MGHSAALFHAPDYVIAVDPWLEGNPSCPETCKSPERLDLIVLTHGHFDHAGEAPRLAKKYGSKVIATYELGSLLMAEGISEGQMIQMNKGGTVEVDALRVSLTHAMHSSSFDTARGSVYAGEACGVVIRDARTSLYHSGDTALFSDMALIKDAYAPQIALLCIGDRFTMGPEEAAKAAKLLGVKKTVPIHHSTFPLLTGSPEEFSKRCAAFGIEAVILPPGEKMSL